MTTVNLDFQTELEALNGGQKVETFKPPVTEQEEKHSLKTIDKEAIFGKDALVGKIPELTQSFILQKSKQDKLMELGQVAQEVFESKKISRSQVIAFESMARDLIPATEEEIASGERKVVVSDHQVNMYTEEASTTEAATTIVNVQANVDRIVSDLRNSAIALGKQLVETAKTDTVERDERVLKSVSLFNKSITAFLIETQSATLDNADIRFKRDLSWGNLMGIQVGRSHNSEDASLEKRIKSFDGTSAETFVKNIFDLVGYGPMSFPVINNFVNGEFRVIRDSGQLPEGDDRLPYTFTIGELFHAFGSSRFTGFYSFMSQEASTQIKATQSAISLLEGETSVEQIVMLSDNLQHQQQCLMNINANMSVIAAVMCLMIDFLDTF